MHTNTTRATQNATFSRRNRQKPALYQHILFDLAVEANQLKTPVSPATGHTSPPPKHFNQQAPWEDGLLIRKGWAGKYKP
ncbi:hypothetical protein HMPREF9238_00697 [Gleimia europaea ACS-120-V-Col10b]|uniref:Uncharacterized protein n=1 Tax=Gleimia europaea ACS-120-V-Col10b TaxID=883069 RepID=A0A9W5REG5_9ACTO|nr:hypothetical protein HMPREF9238_00697 [Gleimia europaea ACS-120-V-Col10b]